jgi:hypothetical protein
MLFFNIVNQDAGRRIMKVNEVEAWRQSAKDLCLASVYSPEDRELVIFNKSDLDRGFLWVTSSDLLGIDPQLASEQDRSDVAATLSPGEALALMGRMSDKVKCQFCSAPLASGERHEHFGRAYGHHAR